MEPRKRFRRSVIIPLALFVYTTCTFAYLMPRNHEVSTTEKVITAVVAYLIITALWLLLRHKEKLARQRENDLKDNKNK